MPTASGLNSFALLAYRIRDHQFDHGAKLLPRFFNEAPRITSGDEIIFSDAELLTVATLIGAGHGLSATMLNMFPGKAKSVFPPKNRSTNDRMSSRGLA